MTVTAVPPQQRVAPSAESPEPQPAPATGLAALVGSGEPRAIGRLFIGTSLLFLLVAGVMGLLTGLEVADVAGGIFGDRQLLQMLTLHHLSGLFLVVLPFLLGLALVVVPLQVGASTVAFPRASAAAYWTYLTSGALVLAAYIADGGPFGGEVDAVDLFVAAFVSLVVSLCVATVSVMTTVLALRAPGMGLRSTPLFSWSMVVAGTVWLLTLPVLAGLLVLFYVDFTYGGGQLFGNGAADLYDRLRWVLWQPALYAAAIPALGIIGDIVPVFAQRRHYRHTVAMVLIGAFGALSFGAWLQFGRLPAPSSEAVQPGRIPWLYEAPWMIVSVAALVTLLGLLGLWTLTLQKGRVRLTSPLMLALCSGLLLTLGVAAGLGTIVRDLDLFGTTWMTGQAYAVLVATLMTAVAGLVLWAPKIYGRLLPEGMGRLVAPLFLVGGLLLAAPLAIAGLMDQRWQVPTVIDHGTTVTDQDAVDVLNLLAVIGGAVVLLAGVLVILTLLRGATRKGATVDDDPWGGHTLEWTTSSPPPVGHFASLPEITSEAPLYDKRHAEAGNGSAGASQETDEPEKPEKEVSA